MPNKNKRYKYFTGSLVTLVKKTLQARERAEREKDRKALKGSIAEQEKEIADRLEEVAEKNKIYSKKSEAFFPHKRSPDSYVVPDELHNRREELRNKSLLSTGTISPFGLMIGALGKKGIDYETMPESEYKRITNMVGSIADEVNKEIEMDRRGFQEGGEAIEGQMDDLMMIPQEEEMVPTETPMESDEEMENNYIDFIVGESLTPEDEEYLLTALEQDDRLSMIFDQVVETASEFAGSGPVEGPGTGMSDSIPARLSDGEFVITSKATEEIGPDKLQGMMEQAEMDADARQMRQAGGYVTETEEEQEEQEIVRAVQPKETQGRLMPRSLADKKVNESMIALNPRNSLFAT